MKRWMKIAGVVAAATVLSTALLEAIETKTVQAASGVAINETNFPDSSFREKIKGFDIDQDGFLSDTEISEVKTLD